MKTVTGIAAAFCMGLHLQAFADYRDYIGHCGVKAATLHATSPVEYSGLWDLDVSGSAVCESGLLVVNVYRRSPSDEMELVEWGHGDVSEGRFEISFSGVRARYVAELMVEIAISNPSPPTEDWCGFTKLGVGVYSLDEHFPVIVTDGMTSCGRNRPVKVLVYFPDAEEIIPADYAKTVRADRDGLFFAERYATSWYYGSVIAVYTDLAY